MTLDVRNLTLENQLCSAIKRHRVIRLRYKSQNYYRTFEPYIIYRSTKENILVGGMQTKDDSRPFKESEPHNFEVEQISSLQITEETFKYDSRFDPTGKEYCNGIFCVIQRTNAV